MLDKYEYWDNIAEQVSSDCKVIKDNWHKRRILLHNLLYYDIEKCDILELGCGAGTTAYFLSGMYGLRVNYTGVDISKKFIKIANALGLNALHTKEADSLPFNDNSFDVLFVFDVLEHIPIEDRQKTYKELYRVLKNKAIVFMNNPLSKSNHNPDFDFGFDDMAIAEMAKALNMRIYEVKTYEGKGSYFYQFVVLRREEKC